MALVLRDPKNNQPVRAVSLGKLSELQPLFYREFSQSLTYAAFRRLVLRDALGFKTLDARFVSSLVRACDPYRTGTVSYHNFARYAKNEQLLAARLGLSVEKKQQPFGEKSPLLRAKSQPSFQGISQKRLRRELARAFSEKEGVSSNQQPDDSASNQQLPKPRRGLLRHEITQLKGAGILLTGGQIFKTVRTVAMDSWLDPNEQAPQLATTI